MSALDTKALLEGVTPGDWFVDEDDREGMGWNRHICSGYSDRICFMSNTGDDPKGEANALLIASAPRLARRVIELEEVVEMFRNYGCPVCQGDCGSANPPVAFCPMKIVCAALNGEQTA